MIDLLWIDIEWGTLVIVSAAAIFGSLVELRRGEPELRERIAKLEAGDPALQVRLTNIEHRLDALEADDGE
jgi:hypothetical protein